MQPVMTLFAIVTLAILHFVHALKTTQNGFLLWDLLDGNNFSE